MSTMAERKKEREREKRRKQLQGAIITSLFGLFFLILGIWGFLGNRSKYLGYKNSKDIRVVSATVDYAEIKSRKDENGGKENYWVAKLKYSVDGKEYTGKHEYLSEVKKGDVLNVEVYRDKKGDFLIPEYTTESLYKLYNVLYLAAAGFGLLLLIIVVVVCLPDKKEKKK